MSNGNLRQLYRRTAANALAVADKDPAPVTIANPTGGSGRVSGCGLAPDCASLCGDDSELTRDLVDSRIADLGSFDLLLGSEEPVEALLDTIHRPRSVLTCGWGAGTQAVDLLLNLRQDLPLSFDASGACVDIAIAVGTGTVGDFVVGETWACSGTVTHLIVPRLARAPGVVRPSRLTIHPISDSRNQPRGRAAESLAPMRIPAPYPPTRPSMCGYAAVSGDQRRD